MEINNSGDAVYKVMLMSFNIARDPDDLLRKKIRPNVIRDMERVVRRVEGLLPSIYMGLEKALEKAPPGSPEWTRYRRELRVVEKILRFLDDPGNSHLIGLPFQPVIIKDNITKVLDMHMFRSRLGVLEPMECAILLYPITTMYPDNMLIDTFIYKLIHCVVIDPYDMITYPVREMLVNLVPGLFVIMQHIPKRIGRAFVEYVKQNRIPVISLETNRIVTNRIATDTKYARQILRKSFIIRLRPSIYWRWS